MSINININSKDLVQVTDMLGRIVTNFPKAMNKNTKEIARMYSEEMRMQLQLMGAIDTGELVGAVSETPKKTDKGYVITFPRYGQYLDKMPDHWVSPHRHPDLFNWAKARIGFVPRRIFVRRKEWIGPSVKRARSRLDMEFENGAVIELFKSKGKTGGI